MGLSNYIVRNDKLTLEAKNDLKHANIRLCDFNPMYESYDFRGKLYDTIIEKICGLSLRCTLTPDIMREMIIDLCRFRDTHFKSDADVMEEHDIYTFYTNKFMRETQDHYFILKDIHSFIYLFETCVKHELTIVASY